jgi:hypothetical protein
MKKIIFTLFVFSLLILSACGSQKEDVIDEEERLEKCSYNMYNCENFKTHQEAQKLYELYGGVNNDVHHLDRDLDGLACETLP